MQFNDDLDRAMARRHRRVFTAVLFALLIRAVFFGALIWGGVRLILHITA